MNDFGSLDKRTAWSTKLGLCLISSASWALVFRSLVEQPTDWRSGLVSAISAVMSTALLVFYDRIKAKGFVVFCLASATLSLAALVAGYDRKLFIGSLVLTSVLGFVAFILGDKADRDTEEKIIRIRKFW